MWHERRRAYSYYYHVAAIFLLLNCLQRFDNSNNCDDQRRFLPQLFTIQEVAAIPLFLVESGKASCYDIDAIRDTIIKIYYKVPSK